MTSAGDRGRDPPGEVALLKPRGLPQKATPSEVPQARETPTPPAQQSTCACSTVGSGVLPTRTRKRLPTPIAWTAVGPMIRGTGSLTFVALAGVAAATDQENQQWLNAIWDYIIGQTIEFMATRSSCYP